MDFRQARVSRNQQREISVLTLPNDNSRSIVVSRELDFSEFDPYSVVHFSRYAVHFEEASRVLLKRLGVLEEIERLQLEFRVLGHCGQFKRPALKGDNLLVQATVSQASDGLTFRILCAVKSGALDPGAKLASGHLDVVLVSAVSKRPKRIPDSVASLLGICPRCPRTGTHG